MKNLAVVVIDMLNPYEHPDADALARNVAGVVEPMAELIRSAREADRVSLVYVNDNYGDFRATRDDLLKQALAGRHRELVEPVAPPAGADFLAKVRHSAFYSTALEYLLRRREIDTLVLCGQVTEQCILYTALDAYVRHYDIRVPVDAVAAIDPALGDAALQMMERNMSVAPVAAAEALRG